MKTIGPEEFEIIQQTIAHWERMIEWAEEHAKELIPSGICSINLRMRNDLGESWSNVDCALCLKYMRNNICSEECPLNLKFGPCGIAGENGWLRVNQCTLQVDATWSDWAKAARLFLKQIKSLLPPCKEIDWTKPVRTVEEPGEPHGVPQLLGQVYSSAFYRIRTEKIFQNGCKVRWDGYVDQYGREVAVEIGPRCIENVPEDPEYIPLKVGDRLKINGQEYMIARVAGWWGLINTFSGTQWGSPRGFNPGRDHLSLSEFRILLQDKADQWQEIYETVRRHRN